jgi:hypothetical protein
MINWDRILITVFKNTPSIYKNETNYQIFLNLKKFYLFQNRISLKSGFL